jgi:putative membrane protein
MRKQILLGIAIFAVSGLVACSDDDDRNNNNNNGDDEAQAVDQGNARGRALTAQAVGEFQGASDNDAIAKAADIVATINNGEIAEANFVVSKTSNTEVHDFAAEMIADHQANNAALQAMTQTHGLAPKTNAVSRTLKTEADQSLAQLMSDTPDQLDRDYIAMQVAMHQEAFVIVDAVKGYVQPSDMQGFLADTSATIDQHRQHAKDVLHDLP